jgi:hypothetical protein
VDDSPISGKTRYGHALVEFSNTHDWFSADVPSDGAFPAHDKLVGKTPLSLPKKSGEISLTLLSDHTAMPEKNGAHGSFQREQIIHQCSAVQTSS